MADPQGTPLAVLVSAASRHDIKFILPLIFCMFPAIGGLVGRPRQTPKMVRADTGYTSQDLLDLLNWCGSNAEIPQRGKDSGSGLGKLQWPVERIIAWLKQFRRVGVCRDRSDSIYEAFVTLTCAMITYRQLVRC